MTRFVGVMIAVSAAYLLGYMGSASMCVLP